MNLALDSSTITQGIQLALAPVFFLTAVSGMLGVLAGRLARIIDRARTVEERACASTDADFVQRAHVELGTLGLRGRLANVSIGLLTLCAVLIGVTIILLFLGETMGLDAARLAVVGFLVGVLCFLLALLCFLVETVLSTRLLNFPVLRK